MVLNQEPIKFVYDITNFSKSSIVLPSFSPDPDTGVSEFVEIARQKCTSGFMYGMGWGENRGQKESTGRAFAKLAGADGVAIRGVLRIYSYNAAGIAMGLVAELDSTELFADVNDRGTWRVFSDTLDMIKENSTFRFYFMSKEATDKTITAANSLMYIDGFRVII